jgi:hypothetical protein
MATADFFLAFCDVEGNFVVVLVRKSNFYSEE